MSSFLKQCILLLLALAMTVLADNNFVGKNEQPLTDRDKVLASLNTTTGGPYTYSQREHHFTGAGYDGSWIDTRSACSGQSGSCRNNPSCQCEVAVGPLPRGTYQLGNMYTFKGMPYCYDLHPVDANMCGRAGFLIHGGSCSANPSEGCIVIEDQNIRYKIKSGATLHVVE